ncbi:exosome subunit Rrp42p homolog, 3'-5' exoribonuclease [Thermococcus kodakarensis KOD1]|uniref:Exosome complex component Rrp42 n=1 Tax=Thermococcus kodakarensis (strain ATCC BAA-918 / JCM 12380 / KOD1) TaxID=69014 RepID=RRP42_THEKO|nr:exosome complex protein Rrp42 [Thermococcus kodakarensis]Q5JIR7.1 RecName: Full=Exosome complex component Rrp42 [Thermococcus kodakarensis KOD1]WCN27565.1 exosome complex protein Rrp42 [Thermococcus kodakarensis]WCN29856.1 exosome complex protein Rrp42 [Thermococcus kodakarensis]BAD85822.1 exosome subunit Rrp42p homolog, 3'-5' exoribonuclease [Thermococcus kodakarensis KOD1]
MSEMEVMASIMRDHIIELLREGKRIDGRSFEDYRDLEIKVNVIEKAEGSAWVRLGDTQVLVGIKAELGEPFPDLPDRGVITTNVELVPLASPTFEPGPPDENAIELARVVDRGIRESQAVDLEKLVIVPGKLVRVIFIDVHVLDHGGNLLDASGIGAIAALLSTKLPKVNYNEETGEVEILDEYEPLPVNHVPIPVTFAKIGNSIVVDPSLDEERVMDGRLTITTDETGHISAAQKGEAGAFKMEEVMYALEVALKKGNEIREKVLKAVGRA